MSASVTKPLRLPERFGRLRWLTSKGQGNGLSDAAWAPIAEVDAAVVPALLAELQAADVPAFAAPVSVRPLSASRGRRPQAAVKQRSRLWVGSGACSRAEETLRIKLPALLRRTGS
jgi:hypothetical protein